jgi:hypothetical protein
MRDAAVFVVERDEAVNLVGDDQDVFLDADFRDLLQFVFRDRQARRVARVIQDDLGRVLDLLCARILDRDRAASAGSMWKPLSSSVVGTLMTSVRSILACGA